jgi:hypothetical protein
VDTASAAIGCRFQLLISGPHTYTTWRSCRKQLTTTTIYPDQSGPLTYLGVALPWSSASNQTHMSSSSIDISHRCTNLLKFLNLDPTSSHTFNTPINIPRIIFQHALGEGTFTTTSYSELLDALSLLAATEGLSEYVIFEFRELALDLLARWLDLDTSDEIDWERRLSLLAALGELRQNLWR